MNSRNIALVALALAAVLFLVPVCSEQSDAVSSEDISLTLPDSAGDSVSITVGNGGSTVSDSDPGDAPLTRNRSVSEAFRAVRGGRRERRNDFSS